MSSEEYFSCLHDDNLFTHLHTCAPRPKSIVMAHPTDRCPYCKGSNPLPILIGRTWLSDIFLKGDHQRTILAKLLLMQLSGFKQRFKVKEGLFFIIVNNLLNQLGHLKAYFHLIVHACHLAQMAGLSL